MPNTRIAAVYAKSILDLSVENGNLEEVLTDMRNISNIISQSKDFENLLMSPIIKADKKQKVFESVFGETLNKTTDAFLSLLIKKGREKYLPLIVSAFQQQYNELKKIKQVTVTTATEMTQDVAQKITEKIASFLPESTIDIIQKVDPELIGGFIIRLDDKLYDASIRKELREINKQFNNNIYTPSL